MCSPRPGRTRPGDAGDPVARTRSTDRGRSRAGRRYRGRRPGRPSRPTSVSDRGRVHGEPLRADAGARRPTAGDSVNRGQQGDEGRIRCRVLDHAAAAPVGTKSRRQLEQRGQPVEHVRLELGRRGGGGPEHPLDAQPGREQIAEDPRTTGVGREIREERRMLPVGDTGEQDRVEVAQHGREALALLGWVSRQGGPDLAGLDRREHRKGLEALVVLGDPFDGLVAVLPELVRRHVTGHAGQSARADRCSPRCKTNREATEAARTARSIGRPVPPVGFEPTLDGV